MRYGESVPAIPKARLSRDALVSSALAIADAEGLSAVSIRRLAAEHAVTPMALYWHFRDKDLLLEATVERVLSEIELPTYPEGESPEWDVRLTDLFTAIVAGLRRHPEIAPMIHRRLMDCDAGRGIGEFCFTALADGGFADDQMAQVGLYSINIMITLVSHPPSAIDGHAPSQASDDAWYATGIDLLLGGIRSLQTSSH
jgi:TetR/AcrR family transcriptional regulator, tetracycline repressor protein